MIVPATGEDIYATVQRLQARLRKLLCFRGQPPELSTSIGIVLSLQDAADARDLLRSADITLFRVKTTRACHARYDAMMSRELESRR